MTLNARVPKPLAPLFELAQAYLQRHLESMAPRLVPGTIAIAGQGLAPSHPGSHAVGLFDLVCWMRPPGGRPGRSRPPEPDEAGRRWGGTVLVADDERLVRNVLKRMLVGFGFEVIEAETGLEALEALDHPGRPPVFVVLDLSMPGMSGGQVLDSIREADASLPVLLVSGHDIEGGPDPHLLDPHTRFIQKPFKLGELERAVGDLLSPP